MTEKLPDGYYIQKLNGEQLNLFSFLRDIPEFKRTFSPQNVLLKIQKTGISKKFFFWVLQMRLKYLKQLSCY